MPGALQPLQMRAELCRGTACRAHYFTSAVLVQERNWSYLAAVAADVASIVAPGTSSPKSLSLLSAMNFLYQSVRSCPPASRFTRPSASLGRIDSPGYRFLPGLILIPSRMDRTMACTGR